MKDPTKFCRICSTRLTNPRSKETLICRTCQSYEDRGFKIIRKEV